jgi:hypothetical protein
MIILDSCSARAGQSWLTKTGVNLKSTESTFQRVPWQAGVRLVLCASQVHEAVLRITSNPLYWYVHTVAYGMYWCLMVLACAWVGMPRSGSDHWLAVAFAYYTWWMRRWDFFWFGFARECHMPGESMNSASVETWNQKWPSCG